ncbi:exodeoxyribonuclease VII large subunit [Cellulosimicrobium sp. BI34T]|uniref:Exodeoxyribonuclease 7 large subunit n=1 Tax=Cellulosimicrobium protaetiae TaxID=2587808 RepID=A0A6M5UFH0_9MICO|nr:exodeoxyribonuclease VII large subunit [Cellulosimicrobium protaetiae]
MTAPLPLPDDAPRPGTRSPRPGDRGPLPARALETSADHPWPVRLLSRKIEQYVDRMAPVWVEGQVVQLNRRPGTSTAFLTLRDTDLDMSLPVSAATRVLDGTPLEEGAHVVVHAKPVFWTRRGTLQLQAREIRPVGVGDLLARIEHLKRVLAAEGLFDTDRKRPLPFLPQVVGLVCGRESKAEHDVVVNARARWPQVRFEIREVAVQGAHAVQQVGDAIRALDADPDVEVIVVARGGGAVEDLLPFSNEALVRVAAACRTPLVSAIGHETDSPLLDLVADYRASTPTAAAKRVVPDVAEERARVTQGRHRLRAAIAGRVAREQAGLDGLRSRPVLAAPGTMLTDRAERVAALRDRARRALDTRLVRASGEVGRLEAQVRALSPASTLDRGYAVVQRADGHVVRSPDDVAADDLLLVRLARGTLDARATGSHAEGRAENRPDTAEGAS